MLTFLSVDLVASTACENMLNKSKGDYAYTMLDVDGAVSDDIVETIRAIDGVIRVFVIK